MARPMTYVVTGVVVAMGAHLAWGQSLGRASISSHDVPPAQVSGVWVDPYAGYHASTAAEGYARGMASMVYAQGQYNLATSAAAVNLAAARQQEIINRKQHIDNYFAARLVNQTARNAERAAHSAARTSKVAQAAPEAKRVNVELLDPATGKIAWPAVLRGEQYASLRLEVEQLFALRSAGAGLDATQKGQVAETVKALLAELKEHVRECDCGQYVTARRFLDRLAQASRETT